MLSPKIKSMILGNFVRVMCTTLCSAPVVS